MKRREVASLAMAIVGVTLILQGISRVGLFLAEGLSRHNFLLEGMGQLRDALRQLGPYVLLSALFAIVPGLLAIRYRDSIARLLFGTDESPQESDAVGLGMDAHVALRLGLTILGAWALYAGAIDICAGAMGLIFAPFEQGLWLRGGLTPFVMGLVKIAMGYVVVFRTSRVVSFIERTGEPER